ncbi:MULTISPECIES: HD family phosphohydrolase [unclassified Treponema]|uniref:HD family phosphohydrolase n=1 Tax=unclassified Treponema TaxID=2638727 RepID=UPI0020A404F1|nr:MULTISPECIES: HDIG domain-containing metalloprotein [unclassified Treponema]UTC65853.1 HDIG domain-containing protein [Treponema sp. OMZ 789]UTC68581.1 HDIG domain-containing protein [Treponema sp. OMZ 790]UTC71312.1 HDIG domain-containing protein [Treponema sp. OMZ 791]
MIKNKKQNKLKEKLSSISLIFKRNKAFVISVLVSFLILSVLIYINAYENSGFSKLTISDFEAGMVSDRDVISNRNIEAIDEKATEIRKTAAKHSIKAVFYKDNSVSENMIREYSEFASFIIGLKDSSKSFTAFKFMFMEKYPVLLSEVDLERIYKSKSFYEITSLALSILKQLLDIGIIEMPLTGLEELNDAEISLRKNQNQKQSYTNVFLTNLVLFYNVKAQIKTFLSDMKKSNLELDVLSVLLPFAQPNILFDAEETEKRVEEALKKVLPVKITIEKNQKIIRRGFIISEDAYTRLKAYIGDGKYVDFWQIAAGIVFLTLSMITSLFLFSQKIIGQNLDFKFKLLLLISFDIVYILLLFVSGISFFSYPLNIVPVLPITFFTMLIAALISRKISVLTVFVFTLAVFGATGFKIQPALFAVLAGLAGAGMVNITGRRMDLIKTASGLILVQPLILLCMFLIFPDSSNDKSVLLLGTAANGFISGILVLGFLPILETLMNVPTNFRLMELSDLNSPIMKKMLITVAGTYNHSMMVASLAESACREIGANSILARVGAYYHDIGKMEQGEYFVENQTNYNKHMDINPRLSATVIRSHVKIGIEKAKQLHLPQAVIDIIAEHHGNSCISYFYAKAKELDPNVDIEDFSYPGIPPRSKESAVVMLADIVEAACRTLEKPSVPRLEKFIDELVSGKIKAGQLDNSDLTFREVNIIKASFVKILAGYYHSRIEYPNQKNIDDDESVQAQKENNNV